MNVRRAIYLIVRDPTIVAGVTTLLANYSIAVRAFQDADSFLHFRSEHGLTREECVITAADLPGTSGLALARRLRALGEALPIIVLTDEVDRELETEAQNSGVTDVIDLALVKAFLIRGNPGLLSHGQTHCGGDAAELRLSNGKTVTFRVMQPADADMEQAFVEGLSNASRHLRFFYALKQLSPKLLNDFTHPDYPADCALIATTPDHGRERQIGVARYSPTEIAGVAEFAVVVADDWQGLGIASRLMHGITVAAAVAGLETLEGVVLRANSAMLKLAQKLGFKTSRNADDPSLVHVSKDLRYSPT